MAKKTTTSKPEYPTFGQWLEQQPPKQLRSLGRLRDRLVRLFRAPKRADIAWQYEVGQALLGLFPADDQRRGQSVMELIGDLVEPGRDRADNSIITALYHWRSMALRCTPKEVADFAAKVGSGLLTQQHIAYLISVTADSNSRTRAQFLRESVKGNWTANELRRQIQADRRHLSSFGGRPSRPRTSSSPALAARQIIILGRTWEACYEEYFQGHGGLLAKTPQKCSPRLMRELERALDTLNKIAKTVPQAKNTLAAIVSRLLGKHPRRTK